MLFELEFEYRCGRSWPVLEFTGHSTRSEVQVTEFVKQVNIKTNIDITELTFKNVNKSSAETIVENGTIVRDQSIKLTRLWADDILLNFDLLQKYINFNPEYHLSYLEFCSKNNIIVDYSPYPFEVFHNGTWQFKFNQPFWLWYSALRHSHVKANFSQDEIELYFGSDATNRIMSLNKLKDLLNV